MKKLTVLLILAGCLPCFLSAVDVRDIPIDMYIILDASSAIQNRKDEAVRWLCDYVVDGLLREGDSLTMLSAAENPAEIFSESISGADAKETAKRILRSVVPGGPSADYAGALREAASRQGRSSRTAYTLLVSASVPGPAAAPLLRYSRVQEFPGWRALVVALNIEKKVREAAGGFMR
jgi:hypothetical protein